jgi:hypothetical protein
MKIKITKLSNYSCWYKDLIGHVFNADAFKDGGAFYIVDKNKKYNNKIIFVDCCEIIKEDPIQEQEKTIPCKDFLPGSKICPPGFGFTCGKRSCLLTAKH